MNILGIAFIHSASLTVPKSPAVLVTLTTDPECGSWTLTALFDNCTIPLALSFFSMTTCAKRDVPIRGELSGAG